MYRSYRLNPSLVQWSSYYGSSSLFGILESVAVAIAFNDMAAMREPVERGPGQAFATQDLDPRLEGQVGGDDEAGAFVSGADHIEEKLGAELAGRSALAGRGESNSPNASGERAAVLAMLGYFHPDMELTLSTIGVLQEDLEAAKEKLVTELSRPRDEARRLMLDW